MIRGTANGRPARRSFVLVGAGGLLAAALIAWGLSPAREAGSDAKSIITLADSRASAGTHASLAIPAAARAPFPASLAGTAVDGSFTIDAAGHFVPDRNALRLFDYFLSASGEESADILRGRILLHAIGAGLSEKSLSEVAAVLDRYLAYREATRAALATGSVAPAGLDARVAEMRGMQRSYLGANLAKAFYGDDDALADIDMQRMAVLRDKKMTRDERQRALTAIDAQLPTELITARKAVTGPAALHERVEGLREAGGSSEDIAALRRAEYGAGAADRLAALDRSRAQWSQRYDSYRGEEQALRGSLGCTDCPAFREARETLRARHFSGRELIRVQALDAERP